MKCFHILPRFYFACFQTPFRKSVNQLIRENVFVDSAFTAFVIERFRH
jgi:hypothetical protein